ncbi:MAG: hypothetical protein COV45_05075 [Deltaproteobacteria bacterium CG11_big_fil_rev_8_21_14_0_20_47_16]|nr:MAG: hypothetical protein COV45_05075 [Deltaproteobacteria bacterium CG11_big_fil_rev_8_21_14_0_20_47_16]
MVNVILAGAAAVAAAFGLGGCEHKVPCPPNSPGSYCFRIQDEYNAQHGGGCQASRVAQLPHVDFAPLGRGLTHLAARFAGVPPIFLHSK